ncbi:MAG: efflux RND transporter periplasmic adaptor subunit, partial [Bdellovibrionota bacterium]
MKRIANSRRALFGLAGIGVAAGLVAAFTSGQKKPAEAPVFSPAPNPYAKGIYANGIIESFQTNGENINIYPEVGGTVTKVLVAEGGAVTAGTPLLQLDDTVQRATAEQLKSQAEAAAALLEELKAQPRKETLDVARAQVDAARAGVRSVQDQLTKVQSSYRLNPKSVARID